MIRHLEAEGAELHCRFEDIAVGPGWAAAVVSEAQDWSLVRCLTGPVLSGSS